MEGKSTYLDFMILEQRVIKSRLVMDIYAVNYMPILQLLDEERTNKCMSVYALVIIHTFTYIFDRDD
jgi:hypothetical protein